MPRILAAVGLLLFALPAPAVIKVLTPLSRVVKETTAIFVAEVDTVAPDKPGVVFKSTEDLKGKAPAERLAVNLTGDNFAKKDEHTKVMLDRLAPGRKLVVFVNQSETTYIAFGFLEGTWFQMRGTTDPDTKAIRWAFLHCEPYFRRTFKGTTAELRAVVADAVAGKKDPPEPDEKEPHGYGPVVEKEKKEPEAAQNPSPPGKRGRGEGDSGSGTEEIDTGLGSQESPSPLTPLPRWRGGPDSSPPLSGRGGVSIPFAVVPSFHLEPLFGVIPSAVLLGPLAILAAVFPATFGGVMSGMNRWRVLLVVISTNSVLATVYFFLDKYKWLPDPVPWWLGERTALMPLLLGIVAVGVVWAGRRYRVAALEDPLVTDPPRGGDFAGVAGTATVIGLMLVGLGWWFGWEQLVLNPGREFTAAFVGLAAAALYSGYRIATKDLDSEAPAPRMSAPGEGVALAAMLVFAAVLLTRAFVPVTGGPAGPGGPELGVGTAGSATPSVTAPKLNDFELWYETREMDKAMSGVGVSDKFVSFGGYRQTAFAIDGVLVCLNRATGKEEWVFDSKKIPAAWKKENENGLRTVYSTPTVANGKLYFGEGLHTDADCRLFCLDATTGNPLWKFETKSHTEGSPMVMGGKVFFAAGDDGLYCADAETGKEVWHYQTDKQRDWELAFQMAGWRGKEVWHSQTDRQPLHIDTPLTVSDGKVFAGSGYQNFVAFCLDATTGREVWRKEVPLRSFGTPLVHGGEVFYGLGTGNLTDDLSTEKEPGRLPEQLAAGMVVCFDLSGKEKWRADLPRSAHTQMAADGRHVYAASRDGWLYTLDRATGKMQWRVSSGLPIVSGVVAATDPSGRLPLAVYLAGPTGQVTCHDPISGATYWSRSVPELIGRRTEVQAPPTLLWLSPDKREVFVPVTLTNRNNAETKGGIVRFTDTDELFPLLLKGIERYEQTGYLKR